MLKILEMNQLKRDIETISKTIETITKANPLASNRLRETVDARFILFKIARDFLNLSFTHIGKLTGKNHATVLYGCRKFDDLMVTDRAFKKNYQLIFRLMQDVELLSKIDSDEFIVDYVELQEKHDDLSIKYNDLLKKVESSAWEYVGRQFGSIHNSVIERILNDSNCSYQLGETLRKVLVKNEN